MKKLPFDFVLPYEDNIFFYLLNNRPKILNEEKPKSQSDSKNFKVKFSQYIKKSSKDIINPKNKKWNKKNALIICSEEIELFIPSKRKSAYFMRTYSNSTRVSGYNSVINVNDFESSSQFDKGRETYGSFINNNSLNNNNLFNNDIQIKNNFNSSISIIKINPNLKGSYFDGNIIAGNKRKISCKGVDFLQKSNKNNNNGSIPPCKCKVKSGVIKIIKDNNGKKNELISNSLPKSPGQLKSFNDFVASY